MDKIKILIEALEIYANDENWVSDNKSDRIKFFYYVDGLAVDDGTLIAKKTLNEIQKS